MRIAQVAPLYESVPPTLYGGTERVVSYLTEELVKLGHEVTLFASGDSVTQARLVPVCPRPLWIGDAGSREDLAHLLRQMELVFEDASRFDLVHLHGTLNFPYLRLHPCVKVATVHGPLTSYRMGDRAQETDEAVASALEEYRDVPLVSISDDQRSPIPNANWQATIYHGLPREMYPFVKRPAGGYLAFLGRISPEKRLDRAVAIARGAGMKLKVAGNVSESDSNYFKTEIEPLLLKSRSFVEYVGEVGGRDKEEFLGNASALLFPIDWAEPFGLVMIEALACGTPVIAWKNGSVPEVIENGVTGFVVDSIEEAVRAVERIPTLDRRACRRAFKARFTAARMAEGYVDVYRRLVEQGPVPVFSRSEAQRWGIAEKLATLRRGQVTEAVGVSRQGAAALLSELLSEMSPEVVAAAKRGEVTSRRAVHAEALRKLGELLPDETAEPKSRPAPVELGFAPMISCITPTADRRQFLPRCIVQFQAQTYPEKELVIVDDGEDDISDLVPNDERIRLIRLSHRRGLGEKRNIALEASKGPLVAHWDDDDVFAPWRLTYQVGELLRSGADLCGLQELYYHREAAGVAWKVRAHQLEAGGTCLYKRALWELYPFRDTIFRCEDGQFFDDLRTNAWFKELSLSDPSFYVVTVHPGNTCCYPYPRAVHHAPLTPEDEVFLAALVAPFRVAQLSRFNREHGLPDPEGQGVAEFRRRAGIEA